MFGNIFPLPVLWVEWNKWILFRVLTVWMENNINLERNHLFFWQFNFKR